MKFAIPTKEGGLMTSYFVKLIPMAMIIGINVNIKNKITGGATNSRPIRSCLPITCSASFLFFPFLILLPLPVCLCYIYIIYIIYFFFLIFLLFFQFFIYFSFCPILLICPYIINLFMICQAFLHKHMYYISYIILFIAVSLSLRSRSCHIPFIVQADCFLV